MNIIFVANDPLLPPITGYRAYTWERIKRLKENGHHIYIFFFTNKSESPLDLSLYKEYGIKVMVFYRNNYCLTLFNRVFKFYACPTIASARMHQKQAIKCILNLTNKKPFNSIVFENISTYTNCPKNTSVSTVLSCHDHEANRLKEVAKSSTIIWKFINIIDSISVEFYERKLYKNNRLTGYTYISEKNMNYYLHNKKIKNALLLPMGYDMKERFQDLFQKNKIVFVGSMRYSINEEAVIWFCNDIFPRIKKFHPTAVFYIIGYNPTRRILALQSDSVIVTGGVEDTYEYIKDAHLYVLPLKSGEGVKIKLIEALAAGNVIVSTSKGIEGTVFRNDKELIVADGVGDFSKACINVLNNRNKYMHLTNNARATLLSNYSWDTIIGKYINFLSGL